MKINSLKLWVVSLLLIFATQLGATPSTSSRCELPACIEDCDPVDQICLKGFQITFLEKKVDWDNGITSFIYLICDRHKTDCQEDCKYEKFKGLDHIDLIFPLLGEDCLKECTKVNGCCSKGCFALGDYSCFNNEQHSKSFVAKCENLKLHKDECFTMTVKFDTKKVELGSTQILLVNKDSKKCHAACIAGPSCTKDCEPPTNGGEPCLTHTIGFWSNHPWVTNDFTPVSVCNVSLGCNDGPLPSVQDPKSDPGCGAGSCNDVMEGLASIPSELDDLNHYISMVRQLTAAKLNLAATFELFSGATCATYRTADGRTIQQLISDCEALCNADETTILNSGCNTALTAFNESADTGFAVVPPPFAQPGIDDNGMNSGADNTSAQEASGNNIVVNKGSCAP